jgi:hypothetical protein
MCKHVIQIILGKEMTEQYKEEHTAVASNF